MLGQEFTPHWVARDMVSQCLKRLPKHESPKILDMCCGSRVFLIEAIKAVRCKYGINIDEFDDVKEELVFSCVMGFDIDPLAVMLAKANWILTMNDLFTIHHGQIVIPIYHADSRFVSTPITECIPEDGVERISLRFDDQEIFLPSLIITPEYGAAYDAFTNCCYSVAMSRAATSYCELSEVYINRLLDTIQTRSGTLFNHDVVQILKMQQKI